MRLPLAVFAMAFVRAVSLRSEDQAHLRTTAAHAAQGRAQDVGERDSDKVEHAHRVGSHTFATTRSSHWKMIGVCCAIFVAYYVLCMALGFAVRGEQPTNSTKGEKQFINLPGSSFKAILLLPLRVLLVLLLWVLLSVILVIPSLLRALYLRLVRGRPSQILNTGTYGAKHMADMHYPSQQLYKEPLDEPRLRKALLELCAEDGVDEKDVELKFIDEKPNDWPSTGSWPSDHFIESNKRPDDPRGRNFFDWMDDRKKRGELAVKMRLHVFNNDPGKPTVLHYYGNGFGWDGSSNYNFVKELMNRYMGNTPNKIFQKPVITAEAAKKFDEPSFLLFFLKMPFNIARNLWFTCWNLTRAFQCFGGNGFGPKITAMNFDEEESGKLYMGCRAVGVSPFGAFTYASVKACDEVLGQHPYGITQQASLQTRHFPIEGQANSRDLVGDWLFGPVQTVPAVYDLKAASDGYQELIREMDTIGPVMQESIMAKAYGLVNSGAATFQVLPTYSTWAHPFHRSIFMNNYGVRTMPEGSPFHTWNWNAPLWFGINTINVDGKTTTLCGSSFWGLEVVEAMRDNIEGTLRTEFMAKAPPGSHSRKCGVAKSPGKSSA